MKNNLLVTLMLFVFSAFLISDVNQIDAAELSGPIYPTFIKDETLAQEVADSALTNFDSIHEDLTKTEYDDAVSGMTYLNVQDETCKEIQTFEGLETLYNLESLFLTGCGLVEIPEQVNELTKLDELSFTGNDIKELSNLDNLVNLEYLALYNNELDSISGLDNLVSLRFLHFDNNNITKVEGLENLTNLERLSFYGNNIEKIEGLETLTNLRYLSFESNNITKIEGLENLVSLETLDLRINEIEKIEGLDNLENLEILYLIDNNIIEIEGLENLHNLDTLMIGQNHISKIQGIDHFDSMYMFSLRSQEFEVYLPYSDTGYNEVFQTVNCPNNSCTLNPDDYLIDHDTYTDVVLNTEYHLQNMYDDFLFTIDSDNSWSFRYSADITIHPVESIDAIDYTDHLSTAASTEEDLLTKIEATTTNDSDSDLIDSLYISDYGSYDLDNPSAGEYEIIVSLNNPNVNVDIDPDFSLLDKKVTYTVSTEPTITTNDMDVHVDDAPRTLEDVLEMLNVEVTDEVGNTYNSDDLISMDCIIDDFGGYDMYNPEVGSYDIHVKYTHTDGSEYMSMSTLNVYDDSEIEVETPEIEADENETTDISVEESEIQNTGIENNIISIIGLIFIVLSALVYRKIK